MTVASRDASLLSMLNDQQLRQRLYGLSVYTIRHAKKFGEAYLQQNWNHYREEAIKFAYYRVVMNRFLASRGLDPEAWLRDQRREHPDVRSARDRTQDYALCLQQFPELVTFVPDPAPDQEEVLKASKTELYILLCAAGSASHYYQLLDRVKSQDSELLVDVHTEVIPDRDDSRPGNDTFSTHHMGYNHTLAVDPRWGASENPFPSLVLDVARYLVIRYGLVPTLYWIWSKLICNDIAKLLRLMGAEEDDTFWGVERDLQRKLHAIDREAPNLQRLPAVRLAVAMAAELN